MKECEIKCTTCNKDLVFCKCSFEIHEKQLRKMRNDVYREQKIKIDKMKRERESQTYEDGRKYFKK